MNKKYTVLPEPYYTDLDDDVRCYDLALSAGDTVTADLSRADSQGDVYASQSDGFNGDWINPERLEEVKDWQSYVPDGLTPIEGDEVVGKLYFQSDEIVKGIVTGVQSAYRDTSGLAGVYITVSEGPEGNIGDQRRFVHQTRILKSAGAGMAVPTPELLAEWERELLSTEGKILLALTEDELEFLANCSLTMVSTHITRPQAESIAAKAKALLPKPKMVTVELTEEEAVRLHNMIGQREGWTDQIAQKVQKAMNSL